MSLLSDRVSVILRRVVRYGTIILWVGFLSLRFYFQKTRPHVFDVSAGRTYPINDSGPVAYLTGNEHDLLQALGLAGVLLGIALVYLQYFRRKTTSSSEDLTPDPPHMLPPAPRLEWWRFGVGALAIAGIFITIAAISRHPRGDFTANLAMTIFSVSLISFIAYRWQKLRVELKDGRFALEKYRENPRRYIRGPLGVLAAWFTFTLALVIGLVAYSSLHQ